MEQTDNKKAETGAALGEAKMSRWKKSKKEADIPYDIEERDARGFTGKHTTITPKSGPTDAQLLAFWNECEANGTLEALKSLRKEGADYFAGLCTGFTNSGYEYWIAVETDTDADVPEGFEYAEAKGAQYAVFPCDGPAHAAVYARWHDIYNRWFPQSAYLNGGGTEVEEYPFGDRAAADYRAVVLVPVRERPPIERKQPMGGFLTAMPFVVIGCLVGVTLAGAEQNRLIGAIIGGGLAWFAYSYITKAIRKKKDGKDEDKS